MAQETRVAQGQLARLPSTSILRRGRTGVLGHLVGLKSCHGGVGGPAYRHALE